MRHEPAGVAGDRCGVLTNAYTVRRTGDDPTADDRVTALNLRHFGPLLIDIAFRTVRPIGLQTGRGDVGPLATEQWLGDLGTTGATRFAKGGQQIGMVRKQLP